MSLPTVDAMIFEGGGTLGVAYCGALTEFVSVYGSLSGVKKFGGSSVGAIFAAVLAAGASVSRVNTLMMGLDFASLKDAPWGVVGDAVRLFENYGVYAGDALESLVESEMQMLTGVSQITFEGLYNLRGTELVITGTNLNRRATVYFSRFFYPDMPISHAVRISSSFPLLFKSVLFDGDTWVDGGVLNNYPLAIFDQTVYGGNGTPSPNTLGFKLMGTDDVDYYIDPTEEYEDADLPVRVQINGITTYLETLVETIYQVAQRVNMSPGDAARTCQIATGNMSSTNFNLSESQKQQLSDAGTMGMRIWLQSRGVTDAKNESASPKSSPHTPRLS